MPWATRPSSKFKATSRLRTRVRKFFNPHSTRIQKLKTSNPSITSTTPSLANSATAANAANKNVHIISLGCARNLVDSEVMAGLLNRGDYAITGDAGNADVII